MSKVSVIIISFFTLLLKMCECNSPALDLKTPRNAYLTAFYKRSFAHHTVKNRMPVIITQTLDSLTRNKEQIREQYGEQGQEELKTVIGSLSKLKYEIQTNKPFRKLISTGSDVDFYNNYISEQFNKDENVTFFSTEWLFSECYMYRRIREAFELTIKLKAYDPFVHQKQEAYFKALPAITSLSNYLTSILQKSNEPNKDEVIKLLKINLWGNKCDLSLSNGKIQSNIEDHFDVESLDANILCDHSEKIWKTLSNISSGVLDIILDNSGYELFTDLCVADYLTSKNLARQVRFYVKSIPWFISDVMTSDFYWTLEQLKNNKDEFVKSLGEKWTNCLNNQTWIIIENDFWTLPIDYTFMSTVDPYLYKKIAEADLAIFKGDLNYRKLFGERNWDPTTPVEDALQNFNPTKLCILRTIKADIVCGLPKGVAEKLDAINENWMETGDYGLIQFSEKIVSV